MNFNKNRVEAVQGVCFNGYFIAIYCYLCSEVKQSLAGLIADRATDEVVEALTRYRRGLGIADSPSIHFEDADTPDVIRNRSSQVCVFTWKIPVSFIFITMCHLIQLQDSVGLVQLRNPDLPRLGLESPTVSSHRFHK